MPLQSVSLQTINLVLYRTRWPLEVSRTELNSDFTAATEVTACRHIHIARFGLLAFTKALAVPQKIWVETLPTSSSKTHTGLCGPTRVRDPKATSLYRTPLMRFIVGPLRRTHAAYPLPEIRRLPSA
jgi:hypothetical protein